MQKQLARSAVNKGGRCHQQQQQQQHVRLHNCSAYITTWSRLLAEQTKIENRESRIQSSFKSSCHAIFERLKPPLRTISLSLSPPPHGPPVFVFVWTSRRMSTLTTTTTVTASVSAPPTPTTTGLGSGSSAQNGNGRTADCRKFSPNIFNKSKCSHCFRQREEHSAAALECNRVSQTIDQKAFWVYLKWYDQMQRAERLSLRPTLPLYLTSARYGLELLPEKS